MLPLIKKKIKKIEKQPATNISPLLPETYLHSNKTTVRTKIGISGFYLLNGQPLSSGNPSTLGGGIFIEPGSFAINQKWRFGIKQDYSVSYGNRSEYEFITGIVYLSRETSFFGFESVYLLPYIGFGGSQVKYTYYTEYLPSMNPYSYLLIESQTMNQVVANYFSIDAGVHIEGIVGESFFYRVTAKSRYLGKSGPGLPSGGLELSMGYIF
ncbi:MAG: hypothetical protein KDK45_00180 [Leptospiraceae bacterium]|nr:hypothetical protein [Leptospiraceae bacterium]